MLKLVYVFIGIVSFLQNSGQDIALFVPEKINYKKANPDTMKLPVSKDDIGFLCKALLHSDKSNADDRSRIFWHALTYPRFFDAYQTTPCYYGLEDRNPVLALWSKSENEKMFTKSLFLTRFFCSYYMFKNKDTIDTYINEHLWNIRPLMTFDTLAVNLKSVFRGTIIERLRQIQSALEKQGLTFVFLKEDYYYKSTFAAFVIRKDDNRQLQKIFKKLGMKIKPWKWVFHHKKFRWPSPKLK